VCVVNLFLLSQLNYLTELMQILKNKKFKAEEVASTLHLFEKERWEQLASFECIIDLLKEWPCYGNYLIVSFNILFIIFSTHSVYLCLFIYYIHVKI
jgi:hypothetical protein